MPRLPGAEQRLQQRITQHAVVERLLQPVQAVPAAGQVVVEGWCVLGHPNSLPARPNAPALVRCPGSSGLEERVTRPVAGSGSG